MFTEPITGERFFGRQEVLDLLNKRVSALKDGYRQNVALTGPSLAGKSSIILQFLHCAREEGFIPIYIEVIKESFESFADKFVATLLYNSLHKTGEDIPLDVKSLLEYARERLPKTYQAARQIYALIERGQSDEAYLSLLALTSTLKSETGVSCVVILDEFDNLEYLGIKNPFLGFGKIIMVQKDTMYIVSSSRNEAIRKIISEKLSLLFGNFEIVKVQNFDIATSNEFLSIRFAGFEMSDSMRKFLIFFSDGNPFYLDKLTAEAKDIACRKMLGYIDRDCVAESILKLVYSAQGSINQYLFNYMLSLLDTKSRDYYLQVLTAIANGRNKALEITRALKSRKTDASKALQRLLELGLISRNGVFYEIEDVMLNFWLKAVYQRRRQILIDGTFDKMKVFAEEVRSHIKNFEDECTMKLELRISSLFNAFSNELVTIDSKNMRLPHFTKVESIKVGDSSAIVVASFRGTSWVVQAFESAVDENDVITFIKNAKCAASKVSNRVILPLKGIEENATLLAKELKISIWDCNLLNRIFTYYGKEKVVVLP